MVRLAPILLTLSLSLLPTTTATLCGYRFGLCAAGATCTPLLPWCRDLTRCIGLCVKPPAQDGDVYQTCGGMVPYPPGPQSCPSSSQCISDPRVPGCGLPCDATGICVPKELTKCGGFVGLACPKGLRCYDDPTDDCDPENGGADCFGICLLPLAETAPEEEEGGDGGPTVRTINGRGPRPALE